MKTLNQQISFQRNDLDRMKRVFPDRVALGQMKLMHANDKIDHAESILATLETLATIQLGRTKQ